jgi:hypothetical protein
MTLHPPLDTVPNGPVALMLGILAGIVIALATTPGPHNWLFWSAIGLGVALSANID